MTHTPGPWIPACNPSSPTARGIDGPHGRRIVKWGGLASPMSDESQANAELIAAAPDLLDALKGLMDLATAGNWVAGVPLKGDEAIAKAHAAIAKAEAT